MLLDDGLSPEGSAPARKRFSGRGAGSATSNAISLSTAAAGDLLIIGVSGYVADPVVAGGDGSWTLIKMAGQSFGFLWKVLTAGDVAAGSISANSGDGSGINVFWACYKVGGPTSAAMKTSASTAGTSLTIPGFARASNSGSALGLVRSAGGAIATPPTGWTADLAETGGTNGGGIYSIDADAYGEAAVTFTFTGSSDIRGVLLELTG